MSASNEKMLCKQIAQIREGLSRHRTAKALARARDEKILQAIEHVVDEIRRSVLTITFSRDELVAKPRLSGKRDRLSRPGLCMLITCMIVFKADS